MGVLGTELESSANTGSAFEHRAVSLPLSMLLSYSYRANRIFLIRTINVGWVFCVFFFLFLKFKEKIIAGLKNNSFKTDFSMKL